MWLMLIVVRFQSGGRLVLPIPLILFWILAAPFVLIGALVLLMSRLRKPRLIIDLCATIGRLGGMAIDITPRHSANVVSVRFV